jgi:hypothetical protein
MQPVSELDQRFSDAGASATPWDEVRQALESAETSWVTTVRSKIFSFAKETFAATRHTF